jgi:hypothetical protein
VLFLELLAMLVFEEGLEQHVPNAHVAKQQVL